MKNLLLAAAIGLQFSSVACMNQVSSKQSGIIGKNQFGVREVFWAKKASDSRYCYFTSVAKFNDQDKFEKIDNTIVANANPISHEALLEEVARDPEAASKAVLIGRAKDFINGAISLAPLAMLAVNHPGIQGVPEVLARVLPAVFWYGTGLTTYLVANNAEYAKENEKLRKEGQQSAGSKASVDNLSGDKPTIQASEAESAVIGASFERLRAKPTNNNQLKCKDLH